MKVVYLILLILFPNLLFAKEISLSIPIKCNYGHNCFIQNYVDIKSSNNHQDYQCGKLSYNKHKGTDFRLIDYRQMNEGVDVVASESGKIIAVRNNEDDFKFLNSGYKAIKNKECGNGVVIDIGDGYELQYCHMLKNSIRVKKGQIVKKGDIVGQVGMSGKSEFPHLHISLKKNSKVIDPFTGYEMENDSDCKNQNIKKYYWQQDLPYIETAILNFHISNQIPKKLNARNGKYRQNLIINSSENIILWSDIMGIKKNDIIIYEITDLKNNKIFYHKNPLKKDYVQYFSYSGKKNKNFVKGKYNATISIVRNGDKILSKTKQINFE